jgi:DNA-directed RNA polymerase subunit RPC12/RpoP
MSTKRAPTPAADGEADPHDIVPDSFLEQYPEADSIADALRAAERAPSTTDRDALPRCPDCGSTKLQLKTGSADRERAIDTAYKCNHCGSHVDDPAPSVNEAVGEQVTLGEVSES